MLNPFWEDSHDQMGFLDYGRFREYTQLGESYFSLVSITDADAALFPSNWSPEYTEAHRLAEEASAHGIPTILFYSSDSDEDVTIYNSIVFRTSFYRSTRKPNEFACPGWSVDFIKTYFDGSVKVRRKGSAPSVGYCGYIDYRNMYEMQKYYLRKAFLTGKEKKRWLKQNIGGRLRGTAVRALQKSPKVVTNVILREGYLGIGKSTEREREQYVHNIVDSDYALVVRGAGNYSYRLYEVLCCGRIPVFVDTDCVLPYDHLIDWKKYFVWVDESEIGRIGDIVAEFHESISETDFVELQHEIRHLYEEWISPVGFYKNLWRCVEGFL